MRHLSCWALTSKPDELLLLGLGLKAVIEAYLGSVCLQRNPQETADICFCGTDGGICNQAQTWVGSN